MIRNLVLAAMFAFSLGAVILATTTPAAAAFDAYMFFNDGK